MSNRSVQKFPSGEVREFEWNEGEEPKVVFFKRAPGDTDTESLIGKSEDELPPPFEARHE